MFDLTLKVKLLVAACAASAFFLLGRSTAPEHVKTEIQTVSVRDEDAIAEAVEKEREKILSDSKANKTRDIIQHPDGTVEMHEVSSNEHRSKKTAFKVVGENLYTETHLDQKSILKTKGNSFSVELLVGKEKSDLISTLPYDRLIYGVNLSKNIFGETWVGLWGVFGQANIFGLSVRQDF